MSYGSRLTLIFLLVTISTVSGQGKSVPRESQLVGTWRLIEFADIDPATSAWTYAYGKHPKGYFTYTKTGIVNLNISSETPLKISQDSASHYTINLRQWTDSNALGYFGTYTLDTKRSVVTHHVTGGSLPWYIDTDQPRPFIIRGDTLIIGDNKTWKRVLVKAD
ncbi:lipocalin-like domain-containing protein [Flavihumibacter petaseus]|uniref:Lipocalin-like domain-containing protein n=1 Tax=Flavihumibacter petaseus NBRC 106054 TaxID=1220578 RepID=A0A0E9MZB7_9BACT|nr:lipocalin-like domain-containing protein [Flavihumibacter petaseus]GAO42736.1 hypothetical protein FPE01S_01_17540 [Flavihumibacter petaseus NBRC 106054]